jgi:Flp pilus assembly protein TadD
MRFPKTLTLLLLVMGLVFALSAWAQQKPLTRDQVQGLVRDGLGDESGAKLVEQRGIDFAPAEDFVQRLKAAGASEAFLKALRAAKRPEPASAKKPLNQVQVFALLAGQVPSHRLAMLVNEHGIDFEPQQDYLDEVRIGGGDDELITALKSAKVTKPVTVDPAAEARQAEVRHHVARGAGLALKGQYAQAEQEYRAALLLDPRNHSLYLSLSVALRGQGKADDAAAAARETLRLNPNDDLAHRILGSLLRGKGDLDGAITEYREALRLNPNDADVHSSLGAALGQKGDLDGAIAEYREALRLNPNDDAAHVDLGIALGSKGDSDGAFAEFREALRLNRNDGDAHVYLGLALAGKGDWDGAIAEIRQALRLNPNDYNARVNLGLALGGKGDWDGAIAEIREALRLNPNKALAHGGLGVALEQKGDRRGALEEYRAAYMLDPKNATYKQNYERLLKKVKK